MLLLPVHTVLWQNSYSRWRNLLRTIEDRGCGGYLSYVTCSTVVKCEIWSSKSASLIVMWNMHQIFSPSYTSYSTMRRIGVQSETIILLKFCWSFVTLVHFQHDRKCNMPIGNATILIKTRKGRKGIVKIHPSLQWQNTLTSEVAINGRTPESAEISWFPASRQTSMLLLQL